MQDSMHHRRPKNTGNDQKYQSSVQRVQPANSLPPSVMGALTGPMPPSNIAAFRNASVHDNDSKYHVPAHAEHQRKDDQDQRNGRMAQHPSNKPMRVEQTLAAGFVAENMATQLTTAVRTSAEAGSSLEAWLPESRPRPNSWRDRRTDSLRPVSVGRICRSDCIARRDRRAARRTAACG